MIEPADLTAHDAIIYTQLPTSWSFERDGARASIAIHGRVRMSAAEGVREAVLAEMGLAISSIWMFSPELANGTVERVLPDWHIRDVDVWAVYPDSCMPTAKARQFPAFVEANLKRRV